jgi:predicted RNase H-like HicB family nuclease/DNA-binding XRE family transcriptional regulator
MRYVAVLKKEGRNVLAEFPDCPGCQTFAEPGEDIRARAREALEGWLEANLVAGRSPPEPRARANRRRISVSVSPRLALAMTIRWARLRAGLTQAQLAKRARMAQPAVARLEDPDWNPTIETLEKVARALGARLEAGLVADDAK